MQSLVPSRSGVRSPSPAGPPAATGSPTARATSRIALALLLSGVWINGALHAGTPAIGGADPNLVPNASLQGTFGVYGVSNATITGDVPTLWRAFAVEGGVMDLQTTALPPDTLFPGSPATQAVTVTVSTFGVDQGFDHSNAVFPFREGISYSPRVYVRSGNSDNSVQSFFVSLPIFDDALTYTGRDGAGVTGNATASWTELTLPTTSGIAGDFYAHLAFRLINDGGENSIILALPTVPGAAVDNIAPNPGFDGTSGAVDGMVTGAVPDDWRGFAVGAGTLDLDAVAVPANELFPGSATTNAVRMQLVSGDGTLEGFDHEVVRSALGSQYRYWSELYLRSGNADMSAQSVTVSMPIFDATGTFTGLAPGSFVVSVGPQWTFFAGPSFFASDGDTTNLAFRLNADGGENTILIAAPRIVGPPGPMLFADGFE